MEAVTRRVLGFVAVAVLAVAALTAVVLCLPLLLPALIVEQFRRRPAPDVIDEHARTAMAALSPDSLPPCTCEDCDEEYARVAGSPLTDREAQVWQALVADLTEWPPYVPGPEGEKA